MATTNAPLVENGLVSTMVVEIAMAATTPMALISPLLRNGTARGMITPSSAVDEANDETIAAVTHSSKATSSGWPRLEMPWAT
ncbi:hypothetical protein D3C79_922390 [compost metagenome]